MTIVYFVIAALALIGAAVLLWLDRQRSTVSRHQRAVWGDQHEFKFRESDAKLRKVFGRATMDVPEHVAVQDVAYGHYKGAEAVVFDLAETATVIAVRRSSGSPVVVDLRHEDVLAPAEEDVELLGAMGPRVMFSNDLDVARRVCDRRMVALANTAPPFVEVLWNEGNWALGSLPLTTDSEQLNTGLDVVRRFADLLRVLPPSVEPQDAPDPRDPHGPTRAELADEKTENMRDKERRGRIAAASDAAGGPIGMEPGLDTEPPSEAPTRAWSAVPDGRQPDNGRRMQPMPVRGQSRGPIAPKTWTPDRRPDPNDPEAGPGERPNRHRKP